MPGKHGWHDGSIQLCCEDGDLEAHAESKKKPIKGLIHSFTECYSKPFNDQVGQAFIAFDQRLRPSDSDELAEHMHGDSGIKFLLNRSLCALLPM